MRFTVQCTSQIDTKQNSVNREYMHCGVLVLILMSILSLSFFTLMKH